MINDAPGAQQSGLRLQPHMIPTLQQAYQGALDQLQPLVREGSVPDDHPRTRYGGDTVTIAPQIHHKPGRRVLTAVEFDVLWEWLGLGATPVVLRLGSPGRTHSERRRIVDTGWQGLRDRGLADVSGPDPEIVRLMHLLAAPTQQVELRMRLGRELRVVTASRSGAAALAVRQDATVTLSSAGPLVAATLGTLPLEPAGPGGSVAVPSADLEAATARSRAGQSVSEALIARDVPDSDALLLEGVLRACGGRRGQLSVLAADQWGVLHRHRKVIGVLDTPKGRYLMYREPADDGVEWTTLAPTDVARLRRRMQRLLAEARALATHR